MTSVLRATCGGGLVFAHPSALLPVTFTFEHSSLELLEPTLSLQHIVGLECQTHDGKGSGFESWQDWMENLLLGQLSVLTLISVSVPPP